MADDDFNEDDTLSYDESYDFETDREKLERLKSMRQNVNWEIEDERRTFFHDLKDLLEDWYEELPNLREIFRREEMDWLLTEFVKTHDGKSQTHPLLQFVVSSGYRDEPQLGTDGKPSARRTTPLHHLFKFCTCPFSNGVAQDLFRIYNRFDVNYTDERGRTHFHAACMYGCDYAVETFLDLGLDLNRLEQDTDLTLIDPPLHLALGNQNKAVFKLLLKHDADPNSANQYGDTPLHLISRSVAHFRPTTVELLLNRGADMSNFAFPEGCFEDDEPFDYEEYDSNLVMAYRVLEVIEIIEKRGYELNRKDGIRFTFLIYHYLLNDVKEDREFWRRHEKLVDEAKKLMVIPSLSLYDLIEMRPDEAKRLLTHKDYYEFKLFLAMGIGEFLGVYASTATDSLL
ncbi:uncharacterized protein LOC111694379 [Trichogramma pretiosum]|uniref:uncharacterized protein LOC111694379 n=1 Tax=Trichogramma pretiosum TaxID=7493 RepID=UPI000C718EDF|nr:uncharacterized protein LOC111694379 [Trichogramma pretiosum]